LTRQEIEGVNFRYGSLEEMTRRYDPAKLRDGFNLVDGEEIFFVSNRPWDSGPTRTLPIEEPHRRRHGPGGRSSVSAGRRPTAGSVPQTQVLGDQFHGIPRVENKGTLDRQVRAPFFPVPAAQVSPATDATFSSIMQPQYQLNSRSIFPALLGRGDRRRITVFICSGE